MRWLKYVLAVLPFLAVWSTFNYVDQGEAGLGWNSVTGEIFLQEPGIHWSSPITLVTIIETRPQRVCIMSSAQAAPNCKLVQFDTKYYKEFVAVEGWRYYSFNNLISFNSGHQETYRGFRDLLRGYAFSAQEYPFVKKIKEQ